MWRITETTLTREHCLRRALELEWLSENSRSPNGGAQAWAEARRWRSLALVAKPSSGEPRSPKLGL